VEEERKKESGKEREKKITVGLVTVTFLLNLFLPHPQACRFMKDVENTISKPVVISLQGFSSLEQTG